jgi:hypothetical protein
MGTYDILACGNSKKLSEKHQLPSRHTTAVCLCQAQNSTKNWAKDGTDGDSKAHLKLHMETLDIIAVKAKQANKNVWRL